MSLYMKPAVIELQAHDCAFCIKVYINTLNCEHIPLVGFVHQKLVWKLYITK